MPDFETKVASLLTSVAALLTARKWRMATAESCTGGWIAKCCTDVTGSSAWFDRAYIAYGYRAKEHSNVAVTVSATGIAGPGGVACPASRLALFILAGVLAISLRVVMR